MATRISRSLLFLLSALGAACGGDPGATRASDGVTVALDEAISENSRHAAACRTAASLSDMLDDVTRHEVAMNGFMAQIASDSDQMRTDMEAHACSEQGLDLMSQDLSDTNAEMTVHDTRMHVADTLGAGQYECSVHAHELRLMLEGMRNDWGSVSCMSK